jgi:DNA-binding FrmR family transcriptional regulator
VSSSDLSATPADAPAGVEIVRRLKRIEGQIRGVQRMVEEGRNCGDILTQLLAVRSSLDQVALHVFNNQIDNCLSPQGTSDPETRRALQEAVKLWAKLA